MKITHDGIGFVMTDGRVIRRYCNYTKLEAIRDFKDYAKHQTKKIVNEKGL